MAHHIETPAQLHQLISSTHCLLLKWGADWCKPCKDIQPTWHALAAENKELKNVVFAHAEVSSSPEMEEEGQHINALPTFEAYIDGKSCKDVVKGANEQVLRAWVARMISAANA